MRGNHAFLCATLRIDALNRTLMRSPSVRNYERLYAHMRRPLATIRRGYLCRLVTAPIRQRGRCLQRYKANESLQALCV